MKRNFLTFVFILTIFSLLSFNSALGQDPGVRDTCWVDRLETVPADTQVVLNIYLVNDENIGGYNVPLAFPDPGTNLDITCDSISFVGTRSEDMAFGSDSASIDNDNNRLVAFAVFVFPVLPPGRGSIAKLYFTTGPTWNPAQACEVDTTLWPPIAKYAFSDETGSNEFYPIFAKGALEVKEVSTPTKPTVFSLSQNYPNPFNPKTIIRFALPKDSRVKLEVYNVLGQKVKTLVDEELTPGLKEVEWDGKDHNGFEVASGIYFYRIEANDFSDIKKMVMLK